MHYYVGRPRSVLFYTCTLAHVDNLGSSRLKKLSYSGLLNAHQLGQFLGAQSASPP